MKTYPTSPQPAQGNTLVMTVVATALIGLVLAAYLSLLKQQNITNFRSQAWNSDIPLIEAGLEHTMAHLNAHLNYDNGIGLELARDGWVARGSNYVTTNWIGNDHYEVTILNYVVGRTNAPEVISIGYITAPLVAVAPAPGPFLAVAAVVNSSSPAAEAAGSCIIRAVDIQCRLDPLWSKGLLARDSIDLKGNNIRSDSYDSWDPNWSLNGLYDPTRYRANGDIACNSGIINSINVGNADIYGHVSTGPGGSVLVGGNGQVGDTTWTPTPTNRIQPGWYRDDMNVDFDPVTTPFDPNACVPPQGGWITNTVVQTTTNTFTSPTYPVGATSPVTTNFTTSATYPGGAGPIITNVTVKGNNTTYSYTYPSSYNYYTTTSSTNEVGTYYDYILNDNATSNSKWVINDLAGSTFVNGNATLYVASRINLAGSDVLRIAPNASLNLYMAGASASFGGSGVINQSGFASNFVYYGLPSNTSLSTSGNGTFTGAINAPNAEVSLGGGGSTVYDYAGAIIARRIVLNGHFTFHFDEALKRGPVRGYLVSSWNELSPAQIQAFATSATSPTP